MQYVLLTITDKKGFITGVDWLINVGEPKEPFVLKYKGEVIHQCVFSMSERESFYALMSLYDPNIIEHLDIFGKERKEGLNKDK